MEPEGRMTEEQAGQAELGGHDLSGVWGSRSGTLGRSSAGTNGWKPVPALRLRPLRIHTGISSPDLERPLLIPPQPPQLPASADGDRGGLETSFHEALRTLIYERFPERPLTLEGHRGRLTLFLSASFQPTCPSSFQGRHRSQHTRGMMTERWEHGTSRQVEHGGERVSEGEFMILDTYLWEVKAYCHIPGCVLENSDDIIGHMRRFILKGQR